MARMRKRYFAAGGGMLAGAGLAVSLLLAGPATASSSPQGHTQPAALSGRAIKVSGSVSAPTPPSGKIAVPASNGAPPAPSSGTAIKVSGPGSELPLPSGSANATPVNGAPAAPPSPAGS